MSSITTKRPLWIPWVAWMWLSLRPDQVWVTTRNTWRLRRSYPRGGFGLRFWLGLLFFNYAGREYHDARAALARAAPPARLKPCAKCGHAFDQDALGKYGCPNCHGEGLKKII